ncbi:MAG: hypothetical protein ACRECD_05310 [Burkholderiaceae bacterium]
MRLQYDPQTHPMPQELPFLIAGGGIGGLAAYVLGQDGHRVTVLEQSSAFGEIGAGIQLGPNIFRMFDYLGLTEGVNQVAFFPPGQGMNDAHRREGGACAAGRGRACRLRRDLPGHPAPGPAAGLPGPAQRDAAYQRQGGIDLADGEQLEGAALIGADGLWSRIREAVVGDGKPRVSGHIAYRAVLPRQDVPAHLWSADVLLWGRRKTQLAHYPLRRGELSKAARSRLALPA